MGGVFSFPVGLFGFGLELILLNMIGTTSDSDCANTALTIDPRYIRIGFVMGVQWAHSGFALCGGGGRCEIVRSEEMW